MTAPFLTRAQVQAFLSRVQFSGLLQSLEARVELMPISAADDGRVPASDQAKPSTAAVALRLGN